MEGRSNTWNEQNWNVLENWASMLFPSTGDLPHPGIKPESPALQADSLASEPSERF